MRAASLPEVFGALTVSLALISLGFVQTFGTISLMSIDLDEEKESWFVSVDILAAIIFALVGGKIAEIIGIRKTFLICSPIIVLGWILVGTFVSTFWMFLGRVLSGIGVSIVMVAPSVYIAETAHPDCRGVLNAINGFSFSFGVCLLWFLGYFFEWQTVAYLANVPPILSFIGFLFLPDTPYWYVQNQKLEKAYEALKYFRRHDNKRDIEDEFHEIVQHLKQKKSMSHLEKLKSMYTRSFIKPFLCIGILYPLYALGGTPAMTSYLQSIMIQSKIALEPRTCSLILGIVQTLASISTVITIQKLPPKMAYVTFVVIKSVALFAMGTFFLLQPYGIDYLAWIPLAMMVLIYISHSFIFSFNWMLMGELFPSELRNFAAGLIECVSYIVVFSMLKLYAQMRDTLGLHGVFFFYGCSGAICCIHATLTIPDNRGKSLSEIESNHDCKTPLIPNRHG